ncbi:unnamed protein product [Gordionus sp. m RMFG-2023]|uniref:uncharacterized protein LOC135925907 n=1 Tax=Gordionus sp. m RMFG-2023 TaxID=3053472 RepID=UPI0030E192C3
MNWLDTTSLSIIATSAFKKAQKKIDRILEIQDEDGANLKFKSNENDSTVIVNESNNSKSNTKISKLTEMLEICKDAIIDKEIQHNFSDKTKGIDIADSWNEWNGEDVIKENVNEILQNNIAIHNIDEVFSNPSPPELVISSASQVNLSLTGSYQDETPNLDDQEGFRSHTNKNANEIVSGLTTEKHLDHNIDDKIYNKTIGHTESNQSFKSTKMKPCFILHSPSHSAILPNQDYNFHDLNLAAQNESLKDHSSDYDDPLATVKIDDNYDSNIEPKMDKVEIEENMAKIYRGLFENEEARTKQEYYNDSKSIKIEKISGDILFDTNNINIIENQKISQSFKNFNVKNDCEYHITDTDINSSSHSTLTFSVLHPPIITPSNDKNILRDDNINFVVDLENKIITDEILLASEDLKSYENNTKSNDKIRFIDGLRESDYITKLLCKADDDNNHIIISASLGKEYKKSINVENINYDNKLPHNNLNIITDNTTLIADVDINLPLNNFLESRDKIMTKYLYHEDVELAEDNVIVDDKLIVAEDHNINANLLLTDFLGAEDLVSETDDRLVKNQSTIDATRMRSNTSSDIEILSLPPTSVCSSDFTGTGNLEEIEEMMKDNSNSFRPYNHPQYLRPLCHIKTHNPSNISAQDGYYDTKSSKTQAKKSAIILPIAATHIKLQPKQDEQDNKAANENSSLILKVREEQILKLSKENMEIKEELAKMRDKINTDHEEVDDLKREFGQRISELEKKLSVANKDKDMLKKQIRSLTADKTSSNIPSITNMNEIHQLNKILEEKDQVINELRGEGEKLSKQHLLHSSLVKKLRSKEKRLETDLNNSNKRVEELTVETNKLKEKLTTKETVEDEHSELLQQITADNILKTERINELEGNYHETLEKSNSLQTGLTGAYKEISALQKSVADKEKTIQEIESDKKLALDIAIKSLKLDMEKDDEDKRIFLCDQVKELDKALEEAKDSGKFREANLQREIDHLRETLKSCENKRADISCDLSSATRPLVIQIDDLKASLVARKDENGRFRREYEQKMETTMTSLEESQKHQNFYRQKIQDLEIEIANISEQLRLSHLNQGEVMRLNTLLNDEIESIKQRKEKLVTEKKSYIEEISSLQFEIRNLKLELDNTKDFKTKQHSTLLSRSSHPALPNDSHKDPLLNLSKLINSSKLNDNDSLYKNPYDYSTALSGSNSNLDQENLVNSYNTRKSKKYYASTSRNMMIVDESDNHPALPLDNRSYYTNDESVGSLGNISSISDTLPFDERQSSISFEESHNSMSTLADEDLIYNQNDHDRDYTNFEGGWVDIEKFEFQIKLKEGHIQKLKSQLRKLTIRINFLNAESSKNSEIYAQLTQTREECATLATDLKQLKFRYSALLEMYGEKEESLQELQLDLQEIKCLYRDQMDILTNNSPKSMLSTNIVDS